MLLSNGIRNWPYDWHTAGKTQDKRGAKVGPMVIELLWLSDDYCPLVSAVMLLNGVDLPRRLSCH